MRTPLIIAATLAVATASAQPFKCIVDGKVIFSDQRCETDRPSAKPAAAPDKGGKAALTPDQERIKALEAIISSKASNDEQKTAAMLEAGNIRRGLEGQLKPEERAQRDALTKALGDADPAKRAAALRGIRAFYKD